MLQNEFESRVKMQVSIEEYSHIEFVYMNSDLDKDEFCKLWSKMNRSRIKEAIEKERARIKMEALRERLWKMIEKYGRKTYDYTSNTPAGLGFTEEEKRMIESVGIRIEQDNWPRRMSSVLFDVRRYLKAA